ncbi:SpaA isopeptide-forming pilin-related protein [Bacillus mobilis]|uniref:SpaA isopeptide-forming pilin-related protein n=1 Tax=Bacillus mobilis TaxID=2026190 RepID=UPI0021CDAE1B|nr:SpaA isopeptide-forming pilin-related protein [Bacillus mobilis]MCU5593169.1 SpaA isopeptide-forming pilin-related protein [Bacillus mobilis]MCU5736269.1 SpaA isopeptide-forming pilin-related protein [Bacillus mobilis]MCU9558300.1 SpaA isopeptide-forming pilin-related protein [Bacillus mobilis]HDR7515137.1 choice-of-anchor A family protein [Bacillus mobilis]HDR7547356.1 choice-of-anchor A family protein [Bacillus mobilis]
MRKSFNQKIKKLSSSFIVVLLVCMNFLIHLPYKAEAATTELKGLGDVSYYNAIIFGDHSATSADIEGAMAIQKNMNASSYTVLAAATGAHNLAGATWVEEGYPALLLGGQFTKAGTGQVIIQDGTVAMTKDGDPEGAMKSSYDRISYKEQAEIDAKFKEFRKDVNSVIGEAGQLHTDKPKPGMTFGIGEDVNNPNIYVSSGQNGKKTFDVKDVFLPNVSNKDFIVIYSDAEEVNFGGGAILYDTTDKGGFTVVNTSQPYDPNSFFTELASKVIWVLPNAKNITTKGYGVVGSVFAPNAVVDTKGGSINGQVFLGGLHQRDGFEVHNFKFNWPKWNKPSGEKVTGQFEIVKVDASDETKLLPDAEFEVYKDGKQIDTLRTDKTGKVISKKLEPGKYTLKETKAPKGYKLLKEEIEVTVEENKVVPVIVKNVKELGSLQVVKKDAESRNVLEGAEFRLKNENGQIVGEAKTTNKNGVVTFENLVPGKYTLEETKAPEGYKAIDVTVEVNVVANKVAKREVLNEKEPSKGPENPGGEIEKPGEETEKPGEETEKPGEETEKPGEETEKPGEETEKPGEETEKPGEETEKPGEETEKPGEETEKPGEETEKPGEETEKPGEETEKPGEETEKPGEETEKPGEETEKPGEETEKPGEETEKPGEETEKPGEETEKPGEETEKPGEETEKPGEETEKPGEETEKPGEETEKPGEETEKPGEETEKPGEETGTPGEETGTPGEETEKPGEETETPGGETEKPGEETEKPGEETEKPGEETEKPGGEIEKPGEETGTPGEETEKPGEGMENVDKGKPTLSEKEQGASHAQRLPATGHDMNYLPFIGFALVLLGIRLRFMIKNS